MLGGLDPPIATVGLIPRAALVYDLSPNGVGLLTTQPPPVGAIVPVKLAGPPGLSSCLILGEIVHNSPETDGLFRVGVVCLEESLGALRTLIDRMTEVGWINT